MTHKIEKKKLHDTERPKNEFRFYFNFEIVSHLHNINLKLEQHNNF